MSSPIYIFDPTITDSQSKVRGVGRYIQLLKENIKNATFVSHTSNVTKDAVFVQPFFNTFQPPLTYSRISRKQIAVIHDCIPHQFPHHFPTGIKGKLFAFLNTNVLKNYDAIVTDSEESKNQINNLLKVPKSRIQIVFPCLPTSFNVNSIPNQPQKNTPLAPPPYFIYVGDTTWNKNLVNIAKAIKQTEFKCLFVGKSFVKYRDNPTLRKDPWLKEYDAFMKLAEGDNRFIFPGYVSDSELVELYAGAVANILISHQEGFGFSFLEAAAYRTPSILSDINIFRETAQDSAVFVDKDDPETIAQAMKEIDKNTDLRKKLSKKAFERSTFFSSTQFSDGWTTVLKNI